MTKRHSGAKIHDEKSTLGRVMNGDLGCLQGRWMQVSFEEDGAVDAPDSHGADGAVMTISGNFFHVALPGAETLIEGRFVIDQTTVPKRMDWIDAIGEEAGKTLPSIYCLVEDRFEFAAANADMPRPEDFSGGQGITIRRFTRL